MTVTKEFVTAGRAIFTLELPEEYRDRQKQKGRDLKPHYTFQVRYKPANGDFSDTYFVSMLTGPENTRDYTYFGLLLPESGFVKTTKKSNWPQNHIITCLLNRALDLVWREDTTALEDAGFKLHHEGKCGRCNRKLTVPRSIETGIGPECEIIMAGGRFASSA